MYIRTKDGVYEVKKVEILCGVKFYDYETREDFVNRIREEQIINQSESLEELCDEFVVVDKRNNVHYLMDYYDVCEELQDGRLYEKDIVYGAIWTSKGLIYVAKLNEKGELCLL